MLKFVRILLWKSWCIRKRHYISTLFELLLPIIFYVILLYTKSLQNDHSGSDSHIIPNATYSPISKSSIMAKPYETNHFKFEIAFSPDDHNTIIKMNKVKDLLSSYKYTIDLIPAANESEIEKIFFKKYGNETRTLSQVVYGLIFYDNSSYTLRPVSQSFETSSIFPAFAMPGPGNSYLAYFTEGFLTLQIAVNDVLYGYSGATPSEFVNFSMTEFPYPSYQLERGFKKLFTILIPMFSLFGFSVIVPNLITNVIQEKNSGSREWMTMVGLPKISVLLSWVLYSLMLYFFTTLICSIIARIPSGGSPILSSSNFFVIWVLLFLFCTSTVLYVLALTCFMNNPNVGVIFGSLLYVLPSVIVSNFQHARNMTYAVKILTCIFPPVALNWAFLAIGSYEANNEKITIFDIFKTPYGKHDISLGIVILFFLVSILLYGLLFLYLDSVRPGKFGRAQPWYFPFKPLLKLCYKDNSENTVLEPTRKSTFEDVKHLPIGLSFDGIKKNFGNVVAIEDVTFDVYKGQITALLGHNGAGKTTLINIITGMLSPTKGKIWKDGRNVFDAFKSFQLHLGLCPQHDLLFPYLNVYEHLIFFGMLRGLSSKKASKESMELLKYFGISEKANSMINTLSGGMKRKLSLSISLIGDPKILILDEPTSGMDPESRRETWNKLLALRGDRTIILTTHYMEEADVLGDMIAIMDHGVLKCYGTSLYLKKKYGSGYKVTIPQCENYDRIDGVVKSFFPEYVLPENGEHESYSFPLERSTVLGNLFKEMEKHLPDQGSKMHVDCTTMDDVFLKVAQGELDVTDAIGEDEEVLLNDSFKSDDVHSNKEYGVNEALSPKPVTGFALFRKRMLALFMKKILFYYRRWFSTLFLTIFYPFILLLLPLISTSFILNNELFDPRLAMELNIYGDTNVLVSSGNAKYSLLTDNLIKMVKHQGSTVHELQNSSSITDALLDVGTENLSKYRLSYIIATNFSQDVPNLYYSSIGTHSPSIVLSLFYKAFYNLSLTGFTTYNHPINFQNDFCNVGTMMLVASVPPTIWMFSFPIAIAIIAFSFSRLHHDERISNGKFLQLMTGTTPLMYWVSAFLCDLVLFVTMSIPILIFNYALDTVHLLSSFSDYGVLWLVLLFSFWSCVWFGYFMSYFLKTFSRLFSINILLTFLLGEVAFFILMIIEEAQSNSGGNNTVSFLHYTLMLYPSFSTSSLIFKVIKYFSLHTVKDLCFHNSDLTAFEQDLFTWDDTGINQELTFLGFSWMIYALLIFLFDFGIFGRIGNYIFTRYAGEIDLSNSISDPDVVHEKSKVEEAINLESFHSNIIVYGLAKKYSRKFTAVKNVSFLVSKGDCFGLLGVNGAGKSTTFKMLTGDLIPSKGFAIIFGDNRENKSKYQSHIGFCPQNDAIIPDLTGYEMLYLYANLRGINPCILDQTVSYWISQFDLQSVANRKCESYSGGNKRKLSTAIALIGDPQLILLDEPTTGVDPVARRKFWSVLSKLRKKGTAIILTSHSMDECEAVCNRLTIMAQGEMKCIGNIQRLKEIYGQGFTIMIQLEEHSDTQLASLKSEITRNFSPNAVLRDEHIGLLHYHITCQDYKWSELFSMMESIKQENVIVKGFIISETTLEQIFLHFAK